MEDNIYICPHCKEYMYITKEDLNCRIFRHASYINNLNNFYNPHASLEQINKDISENKIVGCGKPFRINKDNQTEICDYI